MESPAKKDPDTTLPSRGWSLALERSPLFLSVILLFSVPFLTQPNGADPLYPKQAMTQMMVWLILSAWVVKTAVTGRLDWVWTPSFLPLLAFLGWIFLTTAISPFRVLSWSQLSCWIVYPLWYLLLTFTCTEAWKAENLLLVFLFSAFGTCGWAMKEVLDSEKGFLPNPFQSAWPGGIGAGMGSPDFLAGYLLMVWPVALALYLRAGHFVTRLLWSGLLVLSLICLFWTGSKAGWIGLVGGALVFSFAYFVGKRWWKSIAVVGGIAVLTVVLCLFLPILSERLKTLSLSTRGLSGTKAAVWRGAGEMIKARPFVGTGIGTFEAAFPAFRPPVLSMNPTAGNGEVKHATNWVFEWAAETGFTGLLLLLVVLWQVLAQWGRLFSANAIPKPLGAGVFAAFAGVGVDNLFDWNHCLPTTLAPLLLLAAMPVPLSQRFFRMDGFPIQYREIVLARSRPFFFLLLGGFVFLASNQIQKAFWGQLANFEMKKAKEDLAKGNWDEAIDRCDKALSSDTGCFSAKYDRALAYFNRNKPGDAENALGDLESVEVFAPDYQQLHFKKYEILRSLNRSEEMEAELKRAVRLDPNLIYLTDDFKKARELTYAQKYSMAFIVYQNLILDYPTCVPMLVDYANCLALAHDYPSAINLYHRVLELDPDNSKASNNLQKVSDAQKKAIRLNSSGLGL